MQFGCRQAGSASAGLAAPTRQSSRRVLASAVGGTVNGRMGSAASRAKGADLREDAAGRSESTKYTTADMSGSVIEAMSRAPFAKISSPQPQKAAQTPSGPTPEMTSVAVGATAVVTAAAALIFGRKALSKALGGGKGTSAAATGGATKSSSESKQPSVSLLTVPAASEAPRSSSPSVQATAQAARDASMREQAEALKSQASRMSDEEVQAVWDKVNQQVREEQAKVAAAIKNPPPTTPAEPNGLRFGMSEDDVFKAEAEAFAALTKNKPKPISEAEAAKEQAMRERAEMELAQRFLEAAAADAGMTMEEIYNKASGVKTAARPAGGVPLSEVMDREAKAFEEAKEATISARAAAKAVMAAREEAMQEVADMIMETARNAPKMNMDAIWAAVQARDEAERAKEEERREAARRASEEEEQENARAEEAKAARQQVEAAAAAARQEAMNEVAKKLLESAKRAPKMDMKDIIRKAAAKEDVKAGGTKEQQEEPEEKEPQEEPEEKEQQEEPDAGASAPPSAVGTTEAPQQAAAPETSTPETAETTMDDVAEIAPAGPELPPEPPQLEREKRGSKDSASGMTIIMPGDVKNAVTADDRAHRELRYLCVPLFVYRDGGRGYFIVDLALTVDSNPDRRLICFEDKGDAEAFVGEVGQWEQFSEAKAAQVVLAEPMDMEELVMSRGCKLLVLRKGEVATRKGASEDELVDALQEAYAARLYGRVVDSLAEEQP